MPRTKPFSVVEEAENRRKVVKIWQISQRLNPEQAAKKLGISVMTFYNRMKRPEDIKISEILKMKLSEEETIRLVYGR